MIEGSKEYYYEGNKLIASKINNKFAYYFYDNNSVAGFIYNNNYYFYVKDVLGTIREIIDKDGIVKCSYDYTPFGKVINSSGDETLLVINDILFKGYVYDKETELYWLSSRYYSPELCRFISPDSVDYLDPQSINGLNLYAYCYNNPISYYDPSGHEAIAAGLITVVYYVFIALLISTIAYIESKIHFIENSLTSLENAITDFVGYVSSEITDLFTSEIAYSGNTITGSQEVILPSNLTLTYNLDNDVYYYKRKKAAPRIRSNSKKKS